MVDDGEDIRNIREQALKEFGVTVNAWKAVRCGSQVKEAHEKGENYDVVILDWKMPGDVDGLQTARYPGRGGKRNPVLIMSAYELSEIEEWRRR